MTWLPRLGRCSIAVALAIFFIAGCASPTRPQATFDTQVSQWQGRLLVKVASTPANSFSANFELRGNAQTGQLTFTTPLGTTLAHIEWTPESAVLQTGTGPQTFASLDALTRHATGAELPVAALFSWLQGDARPQSGWETQIDGLSQGRLRAQRRTPLPEVDLRIVLE